MNRPIISGAGGKGGGGGAPRSAVEAPNTLRSKQIAHIIDLLGEGEWEGLVDGPAGIYLNGVQLFTPTSPTGDVIALDLVDEDGAWPVAGAWNFKGVTVEFRPGTQGQSAIRTSSNASATQAVGTAVVNATPITAAITNTDYDVAIVNVQVAALYQQNTENGDLSGYWVDIQIQAKTSGGSWQIVKNDRIEGKTMNPYVRGYAIDLESVGPGPWEVKVVRVSADDATTDKHSETSFIGLTLQTRDKFRYPNSALAAIGFDASQVSSIPERAYDAKMMRCRIPSNYNPMTRAYTGTWDGTFTIAWTDSPPWCMFEMATNERFGLGEYFDEDLLDKWTLYSIAQYCDQLVPNGFGGTEPRFTMNAYFQSSEEAIALLQHMASTFRSIVYFMGGLLVAVQDAPSDPIYAFNRTNVKDGRFSYVGAAGSASHSVAMVVWNNPELQYKQDIEYVEDVDAILRFGYRPMTIQSIGCTSRGQAHRMGTWALYVEQNEADIVTFTTALEGTGVRPGNIIEIYDEDRAGTRLGGRIVDMAANVATLDKAVTLPAGSHTVSYIADDGSLCTRTVTVGAGSFGTLTLVGSDPLPTVGSIFGVQTSTVVAQLFRVLSITERGMEYEISGVAHNPSKYDAVEQGLTLQARPTSAVSTVLSEPTDISFNEALYLLGDESVGIRLSVSWAQQALAMGYMVSYRRGSNNWSAERLVISHDITVDPVSEGWLYSFRIVPISILGKRGLSADASYTVIGEKAPPPAFDFFTCTAQPDGTRQFDFGYNLASTKPIDYKGARIRFGPIGSTNWDDMSPLEGDGFYPFSPFETNQLFSGSYVFAARAEDRTKNLSDPVFIEMTLPTRRLGDVIGEYDAGADGWIESSGGNFTNMGDYLEASAGSFGSWANLSPIWGVATWNDFTTWNWSPASNPQYNDQARDMASIVTGLLDFEVEIENAASYQLYVNYSNDGVTWSGLVSAADPFTARYFIAILIATADADPARPGFNLPVILRTFRYTVGGRAIRETRNDLVISTLTAPYRIGTGDIRFPLSNTFAALSRVTVLAIQDANPGWTWLLVDRDVSVGPNLRFYKNGVLADPAFVDIYIEGH